MHSGMHDFAFINANSCTAVCRIKESYNKRKLMSHFNEHALELSIMELFQQEGYIYTNGEEVPKEVSDVLLRDDMRLYLRSRYKAEGITPQEIERALAKLTANVGFSLYEQNRHTYRLMTEGFSLKREDAALPDLFIEPIDFRKDGIKNNLFRIVNQLEIQGSERRIPDGIVYVNGLPVVVLEFKSAVKEDTTIMDAYTQLTVRYRRDIPDLFRYNAFVVISDGVNGSVLVLRLLLCVAESGGGRQGYRRHQLSFDDDARIVPERKVAERDKGFRILPRFIEKRKEGGLPLSAILCHA